MSSFKFLVRHTLVAGVLLVPLPAFAQGIALDCRLSDRNRSEWIAERLVFIHEAGQKTATVVDPVARIFTGKNLTEVRVLRDNAKRLTLKWELRTIASNGQRARMSYRATIFRGNSTVSVLASPLGYQNSFNARGSCVPYRGAG